MNLRQWLLGCLNSGLKQGGKLLLVILTSFVTGVHLDWKTMASAYTVGFLWGIIEWQQANPIPDQPYEIPFRNFPPHDVPQPEPPKKNNP